MCGIAVLINKGPGKLNVTHLKKMTDRVSHRGPDGAGYQTWNKVGFGHRRLSIIDLTDKAAQPMVHEHLTLIFNGAIYNYKALKAALEQEGYSFISASDTEVLLKCWHCWGASCLDKLQGMWAFAIHDSRLNQVILCRDRFGIKPLHYTATPGYFAAGSEIKQFFVLPDFERKPYEPAVYDFLRHGKCYHNNHTFYEGVYSLEPGHLLYYDLTAHTQKIDRYYSLEKATVTEKKDPDGALFRKLFERSLRLHLLADVPLGFSLSGGLDSSAIVALARQALGPETPMHTITSCNDHPAYDERAFAASVEQDCDTIAHGVVPRLKELFNLEVLAKINYHHDGPIPGGSHFSEYAVFEEARKQGLRVMLGGQGADEILAGYPEFFLLYLSSQLKAGNIRGGIASMRHRSKIKKYSAFKMLGQLANLSVAQRAAIRTNTGHALIRRKWKVAILKKYPEYFPGYRGLLGVHTLKEASLLELGSISIPYQLHSEDRNSMMFSIESRVPFLDHRLVEQMVNLEPENFYADGVDKQPLRRGLKDVLPQKILERTSKLGFASSDEVWMKENPVPVRSILEKAVRFYQEMINGAKVLTRFDEYAAGKGKYDQLFFRLISLYAWQSGWNNGTVQSTEANTTERAGSESH